MASPADRRYSKEHEWVRRDGETARVGITDYAQDQLGDVVYVDLPEAGATIAQFDKMGEIESVKAVSELYSPLAGEVVEVNGKLDGEPALVNNDPFGDGWMIKLKINPADLASLMDAAAYGKLIGQ